MGIEELDCVLPYLLGQLLYGYSFDRGNNMGNYANLIAAISILYG